MTEFASQALSILRDGSQFQWYVIPLFALVVCVYAAEVERKNWDPVFAGLAFWGMDWFNEIWNSLVFHFNGRAPVWGAPGATAYLIFIGLNIEIMFMFAIAGVAFGKMLPPDKKMKIFGIPNRIAIAIGVSQFETKADAHGNFGSGGIAVSDQILGHCADVRAVLCAYGFCHIVNSVADLAVDRLLKHPFAHRVCQSALL